MDNVSGTIKNIWDRMNISYDKFIRTTDADHEKQVQKIFKKLYDQGDIYKSSYNEKGELALAVPEKDMPAGIEIC